MVGINLYIYVFITITGSIHLETARLLVPEATIHPVVSVSTLTWFTPVILVGSVLLTSLVFCVLFCLSSSCVLFPILPVSLDCPFLIAPSGFSYLYLDILIVEI